MSERFELFSKKFGVRQTTQGFIYDDVPESARIGLFHAIFSEIGIPEEGRDIYQRLYVLICNTLKMRWNWSLEFESQFAPAIEGLITKCKWYQFYDICQISYLYLAGESRHTTTIDKDTIKHFQDRLNTLFKDDFLGFEIRDGEIEKIGNPVTDTQIREARYLLKEQEFKGADKHFEKAIKSLNIRPNPDVENCIKDAVAAIESVGRVIVNDDKVLLDDIIKNAAKKGVIPKPLDQTFQKVYAYRGNEPGVAHGAVDISKVTEDEAELILAMSAAMIIYLIKKRSQLSCSPNHLKS